MGKGGLGGGGVEDTGMILFGERAGGIYLVHTGWRFSESVSLLGRDGGGL